MNKHKELLNAILDASLDGLIALSESAEKPYATSVYSAMFPGWEKLRYNDGLDVVRDFYSKYITDVEDLLALIVEVRRTGGFREGRMHRRDGRVIQVIGRIITTPGGGKTEVWVHRDITEQCRQNEQLQLRLQLATSILDASNDAIFTLVEGLEKPLANARYSAIFPDWEKALRYGQPLKELDGFFSRYLVDWEAHNNLVDKVRQTGRYHQTIIHHKDGRIIDLSGKMVNAPFIRRGALEIYTLRDITEYVRGRQRMRGMQMMVDNLSEPVVWCDLGGKITYANQAACSALGYGEPAEITGKGVRHFYRRQRSDKGVSPTWRTLLEALRKDAHIKIDHAILVRKDGTQLPCTILIDYIAQGGQSFLAMCLHDLSEQIQRMEAERATEAKTKFLAKMSHEIRTPLNSIIGMAEILMRRINAREVYREILEFVSIIQQSGMSLLAIINDILDFSKIESGSLQLNEARYSFASLLNDVINIASVQIVEHKAINFIARADVDIPHELRGDEARVRQIFVNLLSNAVKYTNYGYIMLDVKLAERDGDEVTLDLTVKDTGIGIKKEDLKSIFSEFKRVDSKSNQRIEGTGLGLAIVQNLCRLMGGDVRVASEYGSGSEFTATIRQKAGSAKKLASVVDPGRKRVLLLKEQEMQHKSIVSALKDLGLPEPKTAETLSGFMEEIEGGVYDCAFISSRHVQEYFQAREISSPGTRRENGSGTKLVVMADLGDVTAVPGTSGITMPVYCVPLANVLNGGDVSESSVRDANGLPRFSAPAATVLVVDDVLTNLRVAKEFIDCYGIAVETCTDGAEALEMVEDKHYDLIFMDHMMPRMNGLEAMLRIRQLGRDDEYFRNVPIVALTANAVVGQREIFLEHGFNDFLPKPLEAQALDAVLKKWLPLGKQRTIERTARDARAVEAVARPDLVEGLDMEKGIKNVGGRKSAYAGTLSVFRQDCGTLMPRLLTALAEGDLPAYAIAVHALKGSLRTIGAGPLAFSAMRLENAASNGDAGLLKEETQSFLNELQTLTGSFDLVLPVLTARGKAGNGGLSAENGALPRKLDELKQALISMDAQAVNDLLADCLGMELSPGQRTLINEIDMLVMDFEFEKAVQRINEFPSAIE